MDVLAASRLELRLRAAARPRAGRRVHGRGRRRDRVEQAYVENTNVLRTVFSGERGAFELIDFAPRFQLYDRFFKPSMLVRILRPLSGEPRARVRCRPTYEYGLEEIGRWRASNHIEFTGFPTPVRLTTNVPLTYVEDERPFLLERDRHLVLTWGEPLEAGLEETAERFLERTLDYWRRWVKGTRVPRDYQREVVRSALALKLHQYEDTARCSPRRRRASPSIPGRAHVGLPLLLAARRVLHAERARAPRPLRGDGALPRVPPQPRARRTRASSNPPTGSTATPRRPSACSTHLSGFNGDGPVRIGNQAFEHVQNDVYGEMVLGVSRLFLDARFVGEVPRHTAVDIVQGLVDQMDARLEEPDAGLWEFRGKTRLHSFSVLMHWAGARRAVEVAGRTRRAGARRARPLGRGARARGARDPVLERRGRRADAGRGRAAARRGDAARGPPRLLRARRPARRTPRRRDPRGAVGRRRPPPPLHGARRLRAHGGRVHRVHVLARRGARAHRPHRRGARALRAPARSTTGSGSTPRTSSRTRWSRAGTSRRRTATSGSSTPRSASPAAGT